MQNQSVNMSHRNAHMQETFLVQAVCLVLLGDKCGNHLRKSGWQNQFGPNRQVRLMKFHITATASQRHHYTVVRRRSSRELLYVRAPIFFINSVELLLQSWRSNRDRHETNQTPAPLLVPNNCHRTLTNKGHSLRKVHRRNFCCIYVIALFGSNSRRKKLEMAISGTEKAHTAWSAMHHEFGTAAENDLKYQVTCPTAWCRRGMLGKVFPAKVTVIGSLCHSC